MKQDLLWETWMLLAFHNPSPILTASERGRINKALKELREIGATPEELKRKFHAYKSKWPKLGDPSINALTANWNTLGSKPRITPQASYSLPNARPSSEGIKTAYELLPGNMQRMLKAKHGG